MLIQIIATLMVVVQVMDAKKVIFFFAVRIFLDSVIQESNISFSVRFFLPNLCCFFRENMSHVVNL